jgi:hypothetical protein
MREDHAAILCPLPPDERLMPVLAHGEDEHDRTADEEGDDGPWALLDEAERDVERARGTEEEIEG